MSQSPELPAALINSTPWNKEDQAIWIASSLILRRNLARYNFPSKFQDSDGNQVLESLRKAVTSTKQIENPHYFPFQELSNTDRELIFEHFLFSKAYEEPPNDSAMIIDDKAETLTLINTGNHLEMRTLSLSPQWEKSWSTLAHMENEIGKAVGFAFSPRFGYLTADPATCGTGLTIQAYLHLPALIHGGQLQSALANAEDDEVLFMSLSGDLNELIGDLIIVENNYTLGMSEEAIFHAIQTATTKLIGAEKTMRAHLKEEPSIAIKDMTSKAFGLIVHSFQLETKEALDLLSIMKLGLALDYISGVTDEKLSELYYKCRRGHLTKLFPEEKELGQKRADYLQQELSGITLSSELQ